MNIRLLIALILSAITPVTSIADQLFVQLGAYRDITNANPGAAERLGQVQQEALANGLTRFRIVGLSDTNQAQSVLQAAQRAGYRDAFIGGQGAKRLPPSAMEIPAYTGPSDQRINAARAKVPADQHGNIVFLDGKLMLKEGGNFRPLE